MNGDVRTSTHRRRSSSVFHSEDLHLANGTAPKHPNQLSDADEMRISEDAGASNSGLDIPRSDEDLDDDEETGLTHTHRKQRWRRKERNARIDERIAGLDHGLKRVEERMATSSIARDMLVNALLISVWYTSSIAISVYNKWMFSDENLNFPFPLFTTSLHMLVQFAMASTVLFLVPSLRPGASPLTSESHDARYSHLDGAEDQEAIKPVGKPLMTRWFYLSRIAPCGTATALDIGLGNFSLRFIRLTFFTMCKSSVLGFVLLFAFLFQLEKPTWKLCAIILVMTAGVIMMVAGEAAFNAAGFMLVMSASFCSGFRWSLTQILLLRNPATSNPFSSIFFLTPVMFLALIALALPVEGPVKVVHGVGALVGTHGALLGIGILLFPGCLAFLMVAAEFALLKRTSVVTLSVCGIFKEVLTISAAGAAFGDELSPINVSGLFVTIASIAAYNYLKYTKMRSEARKDAHYVLEEDEDALPMRMSSERREDHRIGHAEGRALNRDSLSLAADTNDHARTYVVKSAEAAGRVDLDRKSERLR